MKKLSSILALTGVLALGVAAQAQDPAAPPMAEPAPGGVTVTTETTTGVAAPDPMAVGVEDPGTMPATGGAPIAMALAGTLTAAGAFFMRRKIS